MTEFQQRAVLSNKAWETDEVLFLGEGQSLDRPTLFQGWGTLGQSHWRGGLDIVLAHSQLGLCRLTREDEGDQTHTRWNSNMFSLWGDGMATSLTSVLG